ncbi:Origin recognition complex subunit 4 [Zancudomyces culisetae]|uniref:Origin recognition complex subunit 4 n=1 Tax=Zancudomyces culisetae TaxID=1213189 RepID=A0A1R1PQB3_ZANCU|nr:Origin recognition complex subunit 4 [Zancudomyces culisetae]OMH85335.1 Origin recognition complex subunit 4 [Zancudomyces culisetae]|eukprot:OMH83139.1 Origin recognition complex subunit 4 [Zancudomyces culisetae]
MVSLTNTGYQCFNFEMIYNEYKNLINKYFTSSSTSGGSLKICKKSVALKAFEQLIQAELMCFTGGKSYAGSRSSVTKKSFDSTFEMREFQMMRLLIDTGTLSAAAKKRADLSAPIRRWFAE